ncbi:MAG: flagellar protein FlbB [Micavibrio sp.]|nr:flagellar protein FlbB [Micavibrio sp.]
MLVIVAMLAFSVRLVDFAMGVSSMSGIAFAEEKKTPEMEEAGDTKMKLAMSTPPEENEPEEGGGEEPEGEDITPTAPIAVPSNGIEWRDAKDEAVVKSDVKQDVLNDITARKEALNTRERELIAREALLKAAEQELDQKYRELTVLRNQIEGLLEKQSEEEEARVVSLVKIYEGMKPKNAANIFNTLDLDVLIQVMSKMSERKLSPILASMDAERARTVTIMLAEERQLPRLPKN